MGSLASKSLPVVGTPGPIYQTATELNPGGVAAFDQADRFGKEYENGYPASNEYDTRAPFGNTHEIHRRYAATRNPPVYIDAKSGIYTAGEAKRFANNQYQGKGALVGLGREGNGPGSSDHAETTMTKKGVKFSRATRGMDKKPTASQVPGPGAYKPPLSVGGNFQGKGCPMGVNRPPRAANMIGPGPQAYNMTENIGQHRPKAGFNKGTRYPKTYISKKHTQDVKGLDSPGPVYHYQRATDFGTGMSSVIGTADRNKSEAKRFISKLHTADIKGVGVPGPGTYGADADERTTLKSGGFSFGTSERKTGAGAQTRTPGPGEYVKPSTLKKGGCSFGGGKSRC